MAEGSQAVSAGAEKIEEQNISDGASEPLLAQKSSSDDVASDTTNPASSNGAGPGSGRLEKGFYQV